MEDQQNNQNLPIYTPPAQNAPTSSSSIPQQETKVETFPQEPPPEQPIQNQSQPPANPAGSFPVHETPPPPPPPPSAPLNSFGPLEPENKGFPLKIALISLLITIIAGAGVFLFVQNKKTLTEKQKPSSSYCQTVKVYDSKWGILSTDQLSQLKTGDKVILAVKGQTSSGSFDKARFSINGQISAETAKRKADTGEFYMEYAIPEQVANFQIEGEIHHNSFGWIK